MLNRLTIEGATVYPPEELEAYYRGNFGKEISLAEIYRIGSEIQKKYRDDGYFLTRVIVPAQEIRGGAVEIRVIEGYIHEILYEGEVGSVRSLIESYFAAVADERPVNYDALQRALLLSRDIPGIDVTGTLRPAREQPGAADLVVGMKRKTFEALATVDNQGDQFTGLWEGALGVATNSLTSLGERLALTGFMSDPSEGFSENQRVVQLGASVRPPVDGLYINGVFSYGNSNPGYNIKEFNFESTTLLWGFVGGYPIIRTQDFSLTGELGFDFINTDTDIFGNEKFARDRLRVLSFTARTDFLDNWRGSNRIEASLRQGLPILNASRADDEFTSVPGGSGQFTALNSSVSRLQGITNDLALYAIAAGQYSFDTLLIDEQFKVGGSPFGRGYDYAELSGDNGVGATVELQYNYRLGLSYLSRLQPFLFYDFGKVWSGDGPDGSLSSTGFGLRIWPIESIFFELGGAKPLTRDSQRADGTRDMQFLFRAVGRL